MKKIIWMFWLQGWEQATELSKICIQSWIDLNPSWTVIPLSKENIGDYLDLNKITDDFYAKEPISCTVDIINVNLLKEYGGIWVDSTVLCLKPLDDWLWDYMEAGIFVHKFHPVPAPDTNYCQKLRLLSTWFIAAEKNNYIIERWCEEYNKYWLGRFEPNYYFDFHYLFFDLYHEDCKFRDIFDKIPLRNAHDAHLLNGFIDKALKKEVIDSIIEREIYMAKYQNVYLDKKYRGQEYVKKLLSKKHHNHLQQSNSIIGLVELSELFRKLHEKELKDGILKRLINFFRLKIKCRLQF